MTADNGKTYDCKATLTDSQVLEFCKNGYLLLEGVVSGEVNQTAREYLEADTDYEPTGILSEDWFLEGVVQNREAAGAVRSLLGRDFHMPVLMSNHRVTGPYAVTSGWHVDGNSFWGPELNHLQVFYYPQDTPIEAGPTEVVPGSHLIHNKQRFMGHLNAIRGSVSTAAPEGSIFLTAYQIWHRRGRSTMATLRNMLKYFHWRTVPPERDWIQEPDFDFSAANYGGPSGNFVEKFRGDCKTAEMFLWLSGRHEAYQNLGGQSWPLHAQRNDVAYGFPSELASF